MSTQSLMLLKCWASQQVKMFPGPDFCWGRPQLPPGTGVLIQSEVREFELHNTLLMPKDPP